MASMLANGTITAKGFAHAMHEEYRRHAREVDGRDCSVRTWDQLEEKTRRMYLAVARRLVKRFRIGSRDR